MRDLLMLLIPVIVASLTTILFEQFQKGLTLLDKAPAWTKQILVTVLAFGLTKLAALLGVSLSTTGVVDLKPEDFSALLSSGLAFLFHNGAKTKALVAKVGAVALFVGLAACTPRPAVAMPAPFAPLMIVADTVRITAAPCDADEPTVACRVAVTGTVGQTAITFPAVADVVVGGTATVSASVVCVALQPVSVTVTSRGVNRSGQLSAAQTATATATCPDGAPNVPRSFTIQITVTRP